VWSVRLPKFSNAAPLPLGPNLYVCSEPDTLICVSRADGKILWQKPNALADVLTPDEAAQARDARARRGELQGRLKSLKDELKNLDNRIKQEPDNAELTARQSALKTSLGEVEAQIRPLDKYADPATHDINGYSTPTPATDGRRIYVLFGTGVAACYDPDGNRVWGRFVEKPTQGWGHSASPLVTGKKMLCPIAKMWALDTGTGSDVWKTDTRSAWGSPVLMRAGETDVAVTPAGDILRVADGKLLAGKVSGLDYCAPVAAEGVAYFVQNGGKAIRLPAAAADPFKPEALWQTSIKNDRYYASPVWHKELLYAVTQHGDYSVIDAANGNVVYERKLDLGGTFYPSIALAGDRLYVSSDSGKTLVIEPGREYKEVARNALEPFRSSPVFDGKRMYVRTLQGLYCIGE
jgi:outer membrane protein assembly factor BamB